jgi:hypothetical protein
LLGAEKAVARSGNGFAREDPVCHGVFCLAAVFLPAIEVLAVEKVDPAVLGQGGSRGQHDGGKSGCHQSQCFHVVVVMDGLLRNLVATKVF